MNGANNRPGSVGPMTQTRREQYILFFTLLQVMVGFGVVIPILPHFARELGANSVQMGLLVTVWAGAQFMFSPVWGALSDRIGRRPVLLIGLIGYALTFGLISVAQNIWLVMLSRFLGGVLSAATIPTAQAYVADTSEDSERATRMAAMGTAMNIGFIGGPALGGLLAGLGHRGIFVTAAALALINLILAWFLLPEPSNRKVSAKQRKGFSGLKAVSIALAGPEALLFLLAFAGTYGGSTMFSMLGYFLTDRLQAGEGLLGIAFTVEGAAAVLCQGLLVGPASRRYGEERSVCWALLVGVLGFSALILARSFAMVLIGVVLIGVAISVVRPLVTAMVSRRTRMDQGVTMGIQTAFDALGRSVAPLLAGTVYLWRDWAPFALAILIYLIFYAISRAAWRGQGPTPEVAKAL